jgi:hypothetical protein
MIEYKLGQYISIKSDWPKVSNENLFNYTKVKQLDVDVAVELNMIENYIDRQYTSWNSGVTTISNWNSGPFWNHKDIYYRNN